MSSQATTELDLLLDRLAEFQPTNFPVISLYLNTQPDQHGRAHFDPFVRKEFPARVRTYPAGSRERDSFERDMDRINTYLQAELRPSANGLAIFACAGAKDFFEAMQLDAPLKEHHLYVSNQPHLYPLARINDQYRRYAALIADTHSARLFVFGLGGRQDEERVDNTKINRTEMGGWSQARYQRHVDNYYLHHAKEVVEALDRVVREDVIQHIILAGDEVIVPVLREQLPQHLAEKVIDVLRLNMRTPEHEIMNATLEALREHDAKNDKAKVEAVLNAYRAGGLGVVGARPTLQALVFGQVDELILSADPRQIRDEGEEEGTPLAAEILADAAAAGDESRSDWLADALVTRARQTDAKISFIEDASLLAGVGGVGATLRYRLKKEKPSNEQEEQRESRSL